MRRRILFTFVAFLVGALVILATVPWWLGGVAGWAARSRGLTFASYERVGYARFALREVEVKRANVRVTVARAEADTPLLWAWRHWRGSDGAVVAMSWRVEVGRSTTPGDPNRPRGWLPLRAQLQGIARQLDRWLPQASVGAGVVTFPGGEITLDAAKWTGRTLAVQGLGYRALKANATLAFSRSDDLLRLDAQTLPDAVVPLAAKLESRAADVRGDLAAWEQPAKLSAAFGARGWLPAEATLEAADWTVPGAKLKLGELYSAVRGGAHIAWRADRFVADVSVRGDPLSEKKSVPPLELTVRANGDTSTVTLESLHANIPGVVAQLSAPVTIERGGKIRESAARFAVHADLVQQPWFAAKGSVEGEARLVSGLAASPVVEFSLVAHGVSAREVNLSAVNLRGRLDWPRLQIAEGELTGGEGERFTAHGGYDFKAKEVLDTALAGQIRRQSLARWLPKQAEFDTITLTATASGPMGELKHSGRAQAAAVKISGLHPLALDAEWRGVGLKIEPLTLAATAGGSKLTASATLDREGARVTALELAQAGETRLRLTAPAVVRWTPRLQLDGLQLEGSEGSITAEASGGDTGHIKLAARGLASRWFGDFVPMQGPAWQLTLLALMGSWDRGPMQFTLSAGAALEIGEGRTATATAVARSDKDGVLIEALRATEGDIAVVNATGHVPVTFTPAAKPFVHIAESGPLRIDATVAPNSAFWQKLAIASGVELQEPQASAHLTGTWQRPEGSASLKAARIAIDPKRVARPLPTIENLDVEVTGDRSIVTLSRFSLSVEGQPIRAQGRLPVPDGNWAQLVKQPLAAAQRGADVRIEVPEAEVAVFARFLPAVLAPQGRLQADVHYKSGGFEGFLKLRGAASRPLGPLGVLQEVSADIALSGRRLALRGVTARSGGQPVTLNGTVELPEKGTPRFDLALKGENLPFMRQTGLLLRGDLDLKLQTQGSGPPRLSGNVRLRDSLFLADVRAFLPKGGGTSPARRPPYFSIETPPVNEWGLAIEVTGDRFMRLRTAVFAGVASARFRLGGTLGEPRAIGEVSIDEGRVRMPFASFEVTQASVRLTEADPFEPSIYLRATGRRFGYDLTMEADGSAAQPNVVFTSRPALDSEQVLLMVMTGAAPTNEIAQSATQRMANIGYFLGSSLLGSLGSDAADADRLSIASGEKISRQGRETYDIEYKLSDRWTLTGEYNEFDEYNAGVKWRVFRGKSGSEKNPEHAKK